MYKHFFKRLLDIIFSGLALLSIGRLCGFANAYSAAV